MTWRRGLVTSLNSARPGGPRVTRSPMGPRFSRSYKAPKDDAPNTRYSANVAERRGEVLTRLCGGIAAGSPRSDEVAGRVGMSLTRCAAQPGPRGVRPEALEGKNRQGRAARK